MKYLKLANDDDIDEKTKMLKNYYIGSILMIKGDFREAIDYFKMVVDQKDNLFTIMSFQKIAVCYYNLKDFNNSIKFSTLVANSNVDLFEKIDGIFLLAQTYFELAKYDEAINFFKQILALNSKKSIFIEANLYLGKMYYLGLGCKQDVAMAINYINAITSNKDNQIEPYFTEANILLNNIKNEFAKQHKELLQ